MRKWEYKSVGLKVEPKMYSNTININEFSEELNKYGQQGWELVSCFDTTREHGRSEYVFAVFKREI